MSENTAPAKEFHIEVSRPGVAIVDLLGDETGLARDLIIDAIDKGALWQGFKGKPDRLRDSDAKAQANSMLHLYYNPVVLDEQPRQAQLIEDLKDYSIWYKPYGMRSQGSRWSDHCTLYRWAALHLTPARPAFIVHRLDRAATGLILIAHNRKTAAQLAELFQQRAIDKHYQAIVHGKFPRKPEKYSIKSDIDGKPAISHVRRLDFAPDSKRSLLEIHIETGRKHQIRRHLSGMGFPVVGDRLYGRAGDKENLALTAVSLSFTCPISGWRRSFELDDALRPKL